MKRLAFVGLVACLLAGCRGAKSEGTYEIGPDKLKSADMPAAKSITIEFESKDNVAVTATLVKTEDATAALDAVDSGKSTVEQAVASVKALASQTAPKGTLTSPQNDSKTKYSVLLHSKKATTVTVRSTGK